MASAIALKIAGTNGKLILKKKQGLYIKVKKRGKYNEGGGYNKLNYKGMCPVLFR
jgi:hypothetical protein